MNNILILIPGENARGGITNYYYSLRKHLPSNYYYSIRGNRDFPFGGNLFSELSRMVRDFSQFGRIIRTKGIDLVVISTPFGFKSITRDAVFLLGARVLGCRVIVFFRGGGKARAKKYVDSSLFKLIFSKADAFIVLSQATKDLLARRGFDQKIYLETTVVDEELVDGLNTSQLREKYSHIIHRKNILFLARLEEDKGIFELIHAYEELRAKRDDIKLTVAGDGRDNERIKHLVHERSIPDVEFLGFVEGNDKIAAFRNAHIYVLPSYGEGMPNSVLEAMAFGLPVVTTAVGGLVDFFENGVHGYYVHDLNPDTISNSITKLINNSKRMEQISINNFEYANQRFLAPQVARRMEAIVDAVSKGYV